MLDHLPRAGHPCGRSRPGPESTHDAHSCGERGCRSDHDAHAEASREGDRFRVHRRDAADLESVRQPAIRACNGRRAMTPGARRMVGVAAALAAGVLGSLMTFRSAAGQTASQSASPADEEWLRLGGDGGSTRYSPLSQIDRTTVSRLRIAWRRPAVADELRAAHPELTFGNNRSTPFMSGGVLYAPNAVGLVEAIDPGTGRTLWAQEPPPGQPLTGIATRGVALWRNGRDTRIFTLRNQRLWALDARTGKPRRGLRRQRQHRSDRAARTSRSSDGDVDVCAVCLQRRGHGRRVAQRQHQDPRRAARTRPGVRRPHGQAAVGVQPGSAARRVRQRHVGKRFLVLQRIGERLVGHERGRGTRLRVSADRVADG